MISRLFQYDDRPHRHDLETHVWRDPLSGRWFQCTHCTRCGVGGVARVVEATIEQIGRRAG